MEAIQKILVNHRTEGMLYTHVSMCNVKGKYQIDRNSLEIFWKTYCGLHHKNSSFICGIAEKPQFYLPVLVDVDIKKDITEDDTDDDVILYKQSHIERTIEVYQSIIRKIIDNCTENNLTCLVLEKPSYTEIKNKKKYLKNGFHLHFPFTFFNKIDHEVHLIPRVKETLKKIKLFEDLGFENSGDVIDKGYCKTPWLLYGGRKRENLNSYSVTKAYDSNMEIISVDNALKEYEIYDSNEEKVTFVEPIEFYLPRILSILPFGRCTNEVKHNLDIPYKEYMTTKNNKRRSSYSRSSVTEELKIAEKLLGMLSSHRAEDFNEWITIGWALFNIGKGCSDALNLWTNFSKRCNEKFNESVCVYEWSKMIDKDMTIGTLRHFAKRDNPEEYKKFVTENMVKHISNSLNGSHNDIAKALFEKYNGEFVCASITYKTWYQYVDHRWCRIEEGVGLRKKISDEISRHYVRIGEELFKKLSEANDDGEKAMYNTRINQVQKLIISLKSSPYKSNIMKEAMEVFYDDRFTKKLDRNPYLIGFKNGVYDLKKHIFRKGIPEDFISLKMSVNYDEMITDKSNDVHEVHDFLEKIFPDKSVREYFLDAASDVFIGGNPHKLVMIWSGDGDNGKSITEMIFERMLGEYAIKLPTALITGKRTQSSAACPELVRAGNGVRWAVLQEPDQKDIINIGILKELSGNDTFFARGLYKEGSEIQPMFKLVLICNDPPKLPYNDKATWNRIRVIPFESTFCDDPPISYEEQLREKKFPMDKFFRDKIPKLVKAFAWVLLNHMKKCGKRVEPEKVKLATANYRKRNDIYRQFVEESIQEDMKTKLSLVELYTQFKEWFRDSLPNHSIPIKNEVKEYFIKVWGDPLPGIIWKGYRIRTLQDELIDGDAVILEDHDLVNYGIRL